MTDNQHPSTEAQEERVAAHPIWACNDEAIKAEYRIQLAVVEWERERHRRADTEAERLSWAIEEHERKRGDDADETDRILYDALRAALEATRQASLPDPLSVKRAEAASESIEETS